MLNSVQDAQLHPHKIILAIQTAAYAFTAWRLFARGLARQQAGLVAFLLFRSLEMAVSTLVPQSSQVYFWNYVFFTPFDCLVSLVAVREAIGLVLDDYPGLRTVGRWTMYGAVVVALVCSLVLAAAFWRGTIRTNLYYIEVSNRSIVFGLAVVLISLLIFLSHYPLELSRNRMISTAAFGAIFLSEATALLIDSMAEHYRSTVVDLIAVAFGALCLVVWGVLLQPHEVRTPSGTDPRGPDTAQAGESDRLLRQLKAMEQFARKVGSSA